MFKVKNDDNKFNSYVVARATLRRIMTKSLSEDDLKIICFDLYVDYENLGGNTRRIKVIELIKYCERKKRIHELVEIIRYLRANNVSGQREPTEDFSILSMEFSI